MRISLFFCGFLWKAKHKMEHKNDDIEIENKIIKQVKKNVLKKHSKIISPYFAYGTLWVANIDNEIAETVQKSIEDFYTFKQGEPSQYKVSKNLLAPNEIQPYPEYAFDF